MDIRFFAILAAGIALVAVGTAAVHCLIWLFEHLDPSRPLRAKAETRVDAIEATLRAIRLGLIKIPRVWDVRVR